MTAFAIQLRDGNVPRLFVRIRLLHGVVSAFFLSFFWKPPPLFLGARLSKVISIWSLNDTVSCTTGGGRNDLFRFVEVVGRRSMLHADVCVIAVTW